MVEPAWISTEQLPILVALACVLVAFLIVQRTFKSRGCPFASPAAGPKRAAASMGSLQLTLAQLADYDGRDPSKPLYVAIRGQIYDVSAGRSFYGPGGPYAVFAGRECARALAFMKVTPEDCNADLAGATEAQLQALADWEAKFAAKYGLAGRVVPA